MKLNQFLARLSIALALCAMHACPGAAEDRGPAVRVSPKPSPSKTEISSAKSPPALPLATPSATPASTVPDVSSADTRPPAVYCNCSQPKSETGWAAKDVITLIVSLAGAAVAIVAVGVTAWTSHRTAAQKANEAEVAALQSKLDSFFGPYIQLSRTNELIVTDLKQRHAEGPGMRLLPILLDPDWTKRFSAGELALVEEILSIDAELLKLIHDKAGLVSSTIQPYLWRVAGHFRVMALASKGKLDNDRQRFANYVYPTELDKVMQLEFNRILARITLLQSQPMKLHAAAPELTIPDELKLPQWTNALVETPAESAPSNS
jgi:hypothetical protein